MWDLTRAASRRKINCSKYHSKLVNLANVVHRGTLDKEAKPLYFISVKRSLGLVCDVLVMVTTRAPFHRTNYLLHF